MGGGVISSNRSYPQTEKHRRYLYLVVRIVFNRVFHLYTWDIDHKVMAFILGQFVSCQFDYVYVLSDN